MIMALYGVFYGKGRNYVENGTAGMDFIKWSRSLNEVISLLSKSA
jgi:hypothetical protein